METNPPLKRWLASPSRLFSLGLLSWPLVFGVLALCLWLRASWQIAFFISLPISAFGMCCCLLSVYVRRRSWIHEFALSLCVLTTWAVIGRACYHAFRFFMDSFWK